MLKAMSSILVDSRKSSRRVAGLLLSAGVALAPFSLVASAFEVKVDGAIPAYKVAKGVSGTLKAIGSDSMNNELALWGEGFQKAHPGVKIEVEGKGSSTAPPALIEGTAQLGPMSRLMKSEEIEKFKTKFGYEPTAVKTSLDVLGVFVHRDNPIEGLSIAQVDSLFSKTFKAGGKDIKTWGDLGLKGEWADKPVRLYGRNSASGTYGYFKEHALKGGDFKDTVKEQPGSGAVVQSVADDKYAIGYSGIGYTVPGVRAVKLAAAGTTYIEPNPANAYNGTYPLSRFLVIYVNKSPTANLDPLRAEFLTYVLSREGQEGVVKNGYIPLTPELVAAERKKLAPTTVVK
jgi:phosphate transport system substrate-binding protein